MLGWRKQTDPQDAPFHPPSGTQGLRLRDITRNRSTSGAPRLTIGLTAAASPPASSRSGAPRRRVGRAGSLSQGRPTLADMEALGVAVSLEGLVSALEASWSAETSASPDWSTSLPARGHCAVSALIVQDRLGGDLLRAVVCGESHYWNRLPDGTEIDLTRSQFAVFDPIEVTVASRDYVLSFAETRRRYELLRQRVSRELHAHS